MGKTTIVNCFRKANISVNVQKISVNVESDPFKDLNDDLEELQQRESSPVSEDMMTEILTTRYDYVITTASPLTDEEVEEIEADNDLDDALHEVVANPDVREVERALEILHKFSVFSEKRGQGMQDLVQEF